MAATSEEGTASFRAVIDSTIETASGKLRELSDEIHRNPELALSEHLAHDTLCKFLESEGFTVERGYLGLSTAFLARYTQEVWVDGSQPVLAPSPAAVRAGSVSADGAEEVQIATLAEYDALPGIGHACGHNLIATSAVAAALGVKAALQASPSSVSSSPAAPSAGHRKQKQTIVVMGTPAEEALGGKCMLLQKGAFHHIQAALMVHPTNNPPVIWASSLAIAELRLIFRGQTAHAAMCPWEGVNALDAIVSFYNSISCLRQQMTPKMRVHGIIVDGGKAPNIIPDRTEGVFYIRAPSKEELEGLNKKVIACAEAAALSTGCTVELIWEGHPYLDLKANSTLAELFSRLWNPADLLPRDAQEKVPAGSTDMGNVTYAVPGLHPLYPIPAALGNHTKEFTEAAGSTDGFTATLDISKAMADTIAHLFTNQQLLKEAWQFYDYQGE